MILPLQIFSQSLKYVRLFSYLITYDIQFVNDCVIVTDPIWPETRQRFKLFNTLFIQFFVLYFSAWVPRRSGYSRLLRVFKNIILYTNDNYTMTCDVWRFYTITLFQFLRFNKLTLVRLHNDRKTRRSVTQRNHNKICIHTKFT